MYRGPGREMTTGDIFDVHTALQVSLVEPSRLLMGKPLRDWRKIREEAAKYPPPPGGVQIDDEMHEQADEDHWRRKGTL